MYAQSQALNLNRGATYENRMFDKEALKSLTDIPDQLQESR